MSILVPFWSANIHKRPVWRLLGGVLARPGELVSSSAYRASVHSVLSAEQKLLHSVQVQTKCSELSVHSVLSARQNLCMSGKCRVQCALCVAWGETWDVTGRRSGCGSQSGSARQAAAQRLTHAHSHVPCWLLSSRRAPGRCRCWLTSLTHVCVIPFYTRKRVSSTQHGYKSTSVNPLRHVGIVSDSEARR